MARLPNPGGDSGNWGTILNDYLLQVHQADGTLKPGSVTTTTIAPNAVNSAAIAPGAVTAASLAPNAVNTTILANSAVTAASLNTPTTPTPTNGQVLTLDSTAPGGFKWAPAGSFTQQQADWNATSGVAQVLNKPTLSTVATSGSYGDLANKPTLSTVATSGSYADLSNKPTIPAAQVNADWNAASGMAQIMNKPTLATVATSGSYADLTNKPTIPTVTGTNTGDQTLSLVGNSLSISGSSGNSVTLPTGSTGEVNTASNIGTAGIGVFKQKTGVTLELKKLNAGSNKVTLTDNTVSNTVDIDVTTANLGLSKSDVGLANVDNTSDATKPVSSATQTALDGKLDDSQLDTDGTLAANSDTRIATQKAVKGYVDGKVTVQVQSNWTEADTNSKAYIQNKPSIPSTANYPNNSGVASIVPRPYYIDVRDYGAKGDGVTDDTVAIQAAVNAVGSSNDTKTIYFPAGQYLVGDITTNTPNITLLGCGANGQNITVGAGSAVILVKNGCVGFTFGNGVSTIFQGPKIESLHFRDSTDSATGGIRLRRVNNWIIRDVVCSGFLAGYGILSDGTGNVNQYGLLDNIGIHNCQIGIDCIQTNGLRITGGYMDNYSGSTAVKAGSTAIRFQSGDTLRVIGTVIQFYETHIDLQGGEASVIIAPRFEAFTTAIKNAGIGTYISGANFNNYIIGGSTGTAVLNTGSKLTFIPAHISSVATSLADSSSDTVSLSGLRLILPASGNLTIGDAIMERGTTGNFRVTASLYANRWLVADNSDIGGGILFGSAQDTRITRVAQSVAGVGVNNCFRTGIAATASRPSATAVGKGSQFFDSTLNKPIWSDGTNWRDATGALV